MSLLLRLTATRIALTPVVMGFLLAGPHRPWAYRVAAALFAVAAATDLADGYLARRWQQETALGSFLDTTADKLLVAGVLIALVGVGRASPWAAAVIVAREFVVLGLKGAVASHGALVKPSRSGKLKTNVQFAAILLAVLQLRVDLGPLRLDEWAMFAAALISLTSAVGYLRRYSSAATDEPDLPAERPAVRR